MLRFTKSVPALARSKFEMARAHSYGPLEASAPGANQNARSFSSSQRSASLAATEAASAPICCSRVSRRWPASSASLAAPGPDWFSCRKRPTRCAIPRSSDRPARAPGCLNRRGHRGRRSGMVPTRSHARARAVEAPGLVPGPLSGARQRGTSARADRVQMRCPRRWPARTTRRHARRVLGNALTCNVDGAEIGHGVGVVQRSSDLVEARYPLRIGGDAETGAVGIGEQVYRRRESDRRPRAAANAGLGAPRRGCPRVPWPYPSGSTHRSMGGWCLISLSAYLRELVGLP